MGIAVTQVATGGIPVTPAAAGVPIDVLAAAGTTGIPVTKTLDGSGLPVTAVTGALT